MIEVGDMFSEDDLKIPAVKYEYLDHPADVQIHSWGDDLKEAFEQAAVAVFGYVTDITTVDIREIQEVEVEADDLLSLLYQFLDEFLFLFCADPFFVPRKVEITEFDKENCKLRARGLGEIFDLNKHPQGTEVKAITYSNMQIHDNDELNQHELFVIIDI